MSDKQIGVGDYVYFQYSKKQEFPGKVIGKEKDEFLVEICTNKKKSEGNETETMRGTRSQLRPMFG